MEIGETSHTRKQYKHMKKIIYWTPRILSILFIIFLSLFSLDIFDGNYGFWGTIVGLFMHNIPVIILALILAVAWKYEWVGAAAFFLAGLLYIGLMVSSSIGDGRFKWYMLSYSFIIAGPAILISILFLINWKIKNPLK